MTEAFNLLPCEYGYVHRHTKQMIFKKINQEL